MILIISNKTDWMILEVHFTMGGGMDGEERERDEEREKGENGGERRGGKMSEEG